jgi:MYXO-CTERM domain-containing protein
LAYRESNALACGGCFHPPTETPTVVTDHRMIFSVGTTSSTLWDQIEYSGSPSSFGWVLPIAGTVDVGVSSDRLFTVLDTQTQTVITAPNQNCPGLPSGCAVATPTGGFGAIVDASAGSNVTVLSRQQVGPYDTAQLAATTPQALENWLSQNGFALPDAVKPMVAQYEAEHFNFLAVKLLPGAGVQQMRPIRVTTSGADVALPLRMVAAGTGATVGITLWVVSQGRYEPSNFASFHIEDSEIAWDWTQNRSTYLDLRAAKTAAGNNRIWEIESSTDVSTELISEYLSYNPYPYSDAGSPDYLPTQTEDESAVRQDDLDRLYGNYSSVRITRMRADLGHASLDADLVLKASADQAALSKQRTVTKEVNEPLCPVYNGCVADGTAPRSQAAAKTAANDNSGGGGCSVADGSSEMWLLGAVGFCGFAMRRKRRRIR